MCVWNFEVMGFERGMETQSVDNGIVEKIERLARLRSKMIVWLSAILLSLLLLSIAFMTVLEETAAKPLYAGASINVGIAFALLTVLIGSAVTAFYVLWANRRIDTLVEEVRKLVASGSEGGPE